MIRRRAVKACPKGWSRLHSTFFSNPFPRLRTEVVLLCHHPFIDQCMRRSSDNAHDSLENHDRTFCLNCQLLFEVAPYGVRVISCSTAPLGLRSLVDQIVCQSVDLPCCCSLFHIPCVRHLAATSFDCRACFVMRGSCHQDLDEGTW